MKKILFIVIVVVGVYRLLQVLPKRDVFSPTSGTSVSPTQTLGLKNDVKKNTVIRSIFVPYWTVAVAKPDDFSQFSEVMYFGISPNSEGINQQETGYEKVQTFIEKTNAIPKKWLVIRLNNSDIATIIIEDDIRSSAVIRDSVVVAKRWGFTGILVDLELQALPFESVTNNITKFNRAFAKQTHEGMLEYGITLYGDTYYRPRPYNVNELAIIADKSFIMAYDLHKPNGDPGPNFPLRGKDNYGYDLETLMERLKGIPPEKLVVIFGNFGYNWKINEEGKPSGTAISQTNSVITEQFIDHCIFTNCVYQRDLLSTELKVTYTDGKGEKHLVWMNDEESVRQKEKFLEEKGVYQFSVWAYSY